MLQSGKNSQFASSQINSIENHKLQSVQYAIVVYWESD